MEPQRSSSSSKVLKKNYFYICVWHSFLLRQNSLFSILIYSHTHKEHQRDRRLLESCNNPGAFGNNYLKKKKGKTKTPKILGLKERTFSQQSYTDKLKPGFSQKCYCDAFKSVWQGPLLYFSVVNCFVVFLFEKCGMAVNGSVLFYKISL